MKIVIIDIYPGIRKGLRCIIEEYMGYTISGEADDIESAIKIIGETEADIVIVDIDQGEIHGLQLIGILKGLFPEIRILAMSMYEEPMFAENALRAGANAYLPKMDVADNIIFAVESVVSCGIYHTSSMLF